ncbi:hypothetical protein NYE76_20800 [Paenibacillus sp. FSL M7-0831]|nr:hypothetical protein [Paenibacillus macerans]
MADPAPFLSVHRHSSHRKAASPVAIPENGRFVALLPWRRYPFHAYIAAEPDGQGKVHWKIPIRLTESARHLEISLEISNQAAIFTGKF